MNLRKLYLSFPLDVKLNNSLKSPYLKNISLRESICISRNELLINLFGKTPNQIEEILQSFKIDVILPLFICRNN